MKRKKNSGGGGANWMDTYGDMVTLLLCFFVLLYSISVIDETKWIALVRSFNPNATLEETVTSGDDGPVADPTDPDAGLTIGDPSVTQEEVDEALEKLYQSLKDYVQEQQAEPNISVTKGDGYVFVSFNDAVFFDGDSWVLRDDGKVVLDQIAEVLEQAKPYIDEVRIMGHTAQASQERANTVSVDRFLASNRATVTLVYIQENTTLDPGRLISAGYGQWRPVGENDTEEGRTKNRRVEMIVTGLDIEDGLGDSIDQYYIMRDDGDGETPEPAAPVGAPPEADAGGKEQ